MPGILLRSQSIQTELFFRFIPDPQNSRYFFLSFQIRESEPNRQTLAPFDLISALANLTPGEDHELYRGTPGTGLPTIIVSTAQEDEVSDRPRG